MSEQIYKKNKTSTNFIVIPVERIRLSFEKKFIRQLQLLCYLKFYPTGKIKLTPETLKDLQEATNTRKKETLLKRLKWLQNNSFLGYDPESQVIFLFNWKRIYKEHQFQYRSGAMLFPKDIPHFEAWCFSVIIKYIIKIKKRNHRLQMREQGRRVKIRSREVPLFGLSHRIIRKELNISDLRVTKLKKDAVIWGYLEIKPEPLKRIDHIQAKVLQESGKPVIKIGRGFYTRGFDKFKSQLPMKAKRKNHVFYTSKNESNYIGRYKKYESFKNRN